MEAVEESQINTKTAATRAATIPAAISNTPEGKNATNPEPNSTESAAMTKRQTDTTTALCSQSHPIFEDPTGYVNAADGSHPGPNLPYSPGLEMPRHGGPAWTQVAPPRGPNACIWED